MARKKPRPFVPACFDVSEKFDRALSLGAKAIARSLDPWYDERRVFQQKIDEELGRRVREKNRELSRDGVAGSDDIKAIRRRDKWLRDRGL